jgi:tagatose-1,6-bisphosphate aldolase non-catalytic subunit AgaZ/GatZ
MDLNNKFDSSRLRDESIKNSVPVVELLLKKLKDLSIKEGYGSTLFAVCPNSFNVLKAAIRSAKRSNAPILFAATLNQVDIDRGYTGWTPDDLMRIINRESSSIGYGGPIISAIDHGGPWVKDIQTIEKWDLKRAMDWTKRSFEAAILAGYDLIHVDPTVDIFFENIKIETVVERTIELIGHSEVFRKKNGKPAISYEVGTEEVKGGLADIPTFKKFLHLLKEGLEKKGLEYIWPVFVVGKVGTDLHTTEFDPEIAGRLVDIAAKNNTYIKGHYTDFVINPEDYPRTGVAAANVGPEFTALEYEGFMQLFKIEEKLYEDNRIAKKSSYKQVLEKAVIDSSRWKKWLKPGEKDLGSIAPDRKELIIKTSARYVWAQPEVKVSQMQLYDNLEQNGYDPENFILLKIESAMDRYFRKFNLMDINYRYTQE